MSRSKISSVTSSNRRRCGTFSRTRRNRACLAVEQLEQRLLLCRGVPEGSNNDTLPAATSLNLAEDPSGSGYLIASGCGSVDPATNGDYWSDPDYWSVPLLAGDVVSVSVDTPLSGLNPYVELHNAADGYLTADDNSGSNPDSFISHYTIASSGTYYVRVGKYYSGNTPGEYELRVDVARGIQLESDANYSNDTIAGANALTLTRGTPGHLTATVTGTVMSPYGSNRDDDLFLLGTLSAGNVVELSIRQPSDGKVVARLRLVDSSGAIVPDADGNELDGHFRGTVSSDGMYYAKVDSLWAYGGHRYLITETGLAWAAAEAQAMGLGGHLATINDAAEQAWIERTLNETLRVVAGARAECLLLCKSCSAMECFSCRLAMHNAPGSLRWSKPYVCDGVHRCPSPS